MASVIDHIRFMCRNLVRIMLDFIAASTFSLIALCLKLLKPHFLLELLGGLAVPHPIQVVPQLQRAPWINLPVQRGEGSLLDPPPHILLVCKFRAIQLVMVLQPCQGAHPAKMLGEAHKAVTPSGDSPCALDPSCSVVHRHELVSCRPPEGGRHRGFLIEGPPLQRRTSWRTSLGDLGLLRRRPLSDLPGYDPSPPPLNPNCGLILARALPFWKLSERRDLSIRSSNGSY